MFGADTKASFADFLSEGQNLLFSVQLIYNTFPKLFVFVFVTNYPISCKLLMDIIIVIL